MAEPVQDEKEHSDWFSERSESVCSRPIRAAMMDHSRTEFTELCSPPIFSHAVEPIFSQYRPHASSITSVSLEV